MHAAHVAGQTHAFQALVHMSLAVTEARPRSQSKISSAIVKFRAAIAKRVAVLLRWHSDSGSYRNSFARPRRSHDGPVQRREAKTRRERVDVLMIVGKKVMFWLLACGGVWR